MDTRPKPHKRTHLKHPEQSEHSESGDQSWLRRFLFALGLIGVVSAAVVYYYISNYGAGVERDAYVSVQVRTLVGAEKRVVCKLSLVVDPKQEMGVLGHQKLLEAVVSQSLLEAYQHEERPDLSDVRENLYLKINQKLPPQLQIREVLVQELTVGFR